MDVHDAIRSPKVALSFAPERAVVLQRKCACGQHTIGGSNCAACSNKEETLQRSAAYGRQNTQATRAVPASVHRVLRSAGRPLDAQTRSAMESRFGHDFSQVRVHTDTQAADSADAVNALAYTVGRDVVFGAGRYAPHSSDGRKLLSHELAHVVQQRRAHARGTLEMGEPSSALEREADSAAHEAGKHLLREASRASLQRQPQPHEAGKPPNLGPPLQEVPLPPRCSIIWKDGKWSWKCEGIPKIGSTPEIPLDPRDIPGRIKDLLPKGQDGKSPPGGTRTFPVPGTDLPPHWMEDLCKRNPVSPLCVPFGDKDKKDDGKTKPGDVPNRPIGVFWTFDVLFNYDQPAVKASSGNGGMTDEGAASLASTIALLNGDPTLEVRIIGHASSEGDAAHNMELSKRRARFIYQQLEEANLGGRVINPIDPDKKADGCTRLDPGLWACGELKAAPKEARPEERKVELTFLRNPPLPTGPFKLTTPGLLRPKGE